MIFRQQRSLSGAQVVDSDRGLGGDLHAVAGHHGRQRRAAGHPALAALLVLRPAMGRRRLRADARHLPAHRGLGRRPGRAQARVHHWPVRVHDLLRGLRPVHDAAGAEPRAGRAGHRRGDDVRHRPGAARAGIPRQGAGDGLWRVRRGHRRRRGGRAGDRRDHHLRHRLGVDLLRQHPDRHHRGVHRVHPGGGLARPRRHRRRLGGPRDILRGVVPARVRARAGQRKGLGLDRDRRPSWAARSYCWWRS